MTGWSDVKARVIIEELHGGPLNLSNVLALQELGRDRLALPTMNSV
jgi:hypothetical protein